MINLIVATQTSGILRPFAWILGKILEVVYDGLSFIGIYNIGICIIIFTFVVRMLLFPSTIHQQKSSRLNSVVMPEVQAIQEKYKGKKDQQSQMAQQEEIKAVYDKYGTSATSGCLSLIIQLPILFSLYRVIRNVPAYVKPVKNLYISLLNALDSAQMNQFFGVEKAGSKLSGSEVNECIDAMTGYAQSSDDVISLTDGTSLKTILDAVGGDIADKINQINHFLGFDISLSPGNMFNAGMIGIVAALSIPILAGLFQLISAQMSMRVNKTASTSGSGSMGTSMKIMNYFMPLISVFMCWQLSIGIGIYWMAGSLVAMLQQIIVMIYFRHLDIDTIIEQNKAKAEKKANKRKAKKGIYRDKVIDGAKVNTKNLSSNASQGSAAKSQDKEEQVRKAREAMGSSRGSIASRANLVSDYDKRNAKKK